MRINDRGVGYMEKLPYLEQPSNNLYRPFSRSNNSYNVNHKY
jgi:hypothetical protein